MRRARGGDVSAYAALVRRHERVVVRVAVTVGQGAVDAEAVAQEAFLKAHRALPGFAHGAEFRPGCSRSPRTRPATSAARRVVACPRSDA